MTHREPEPNTNAAIEFLKQVYPDGPWLLTAIRPDPKAIETKTFYPEDMPVLLAWLNKCNGGWNVYWSVNPPLRALSKKADKVLIDEKEGRRIAIQCGISVTGVLGILLRAKLIGQIEYIQPEIEKLRSLAGFYIAPSLSVKVLRMSGEG